MRLVRGNHDDRGAWQLRDLWASAHEAFYLRVDNDVSAYLSHYAHRVWRNSHRGAYHIHGHSHGGLRKWEHSSREWAVQDKREIPYGRSTDVSANCIDYKPRCLTAIVEELKNQPHINHHEPT